VERGAERAPRFVDGGGLPVGEARARWGVHAAGVSGEDPHRGVRGVSRGAGGGAGRDGLGRRSGVGRGGGGRPSGGGGLGALGEGGGGDR